MSLPVWATPDEQGISTYPEGLCGGLGNKMLHIHDPKGWAAGLCGVGGYGLVEYLGRQSDRPAGAAPIRVKVCPACRRKADATR